MADYYPLVARAVAGLEENSGEARRALYERARAALVKQLRGVSPSLTESEITRERLALEEAIRKVEAEQARRNRSERAAATPAAAEPARDDSASSTAAAAAEAVAPAAASEPAAAPSPQPEPPAAAEPRPRRRRPEPPPTDVAVDRPADTRPQSSAEPPSPPRDIAAEQTEAALRALRERLAAAGGNRPRGGGAHPTAEAAPESAPTAATAKEPPGDMTPPLGDDEGYDVHQPPAAERRRSGIALKIVIAIVILAVLGAVGAVGYRQRDRLVALYHAFTGQQTVASRQPAEKPKIEDRIGPTNPQPTPGSEERQTPQPVQPPPAVAQRVVLYEEDPKDPNGKRFVGSVIWRTETVSPGSGLAPELAVKATVEVPERHFQMTFSMVRNTDPALPASHTIDIRFTLPPNFPGGGVANVPGILMKQTEQTRGVPLAGLAVKVTNNVFLIGLSAVDTDVQRNTQLLKDRAWFDIPIVYSNGSRAILAMEKGTPGERAFDEAFTAWGRAGTAAR